MKALVLNAIGRGFDLEDVEIATPIGHEVLVDVQASGLCHTDLLFATHDFVRRRRCSVTRSPGSCLQSAPT
jgi:S-(hydroxymethyl)glutathione dehydrogenase/alcohol dehydrogenase